MGKMKERGDIQASVAFFLDGKLPVSAHILDIGTRYGSFLEQLAIRGYRHTTGVDVNRDAITEGREAYPKLNLQIYGGERLPYRDKQFDVVTMFDVIEHCPDVPAFMLEVHRVLKPGGVFMFQTPNKFWNAPWEWFAHGKFWADRHCSLQTYRTLWTNLRVAGFNRLEFVSKTCDTPFKRKLAREKGGLFALLVLWLVGKLPLPIPWRTGYWGRCRR
jgi:SAM-dependent methyltransferase